MMNNRVDIMLDIETLGLDTDSTIIQISAVYFNIENGEIYDYYNFNRLLDIENSKINADGSTIKWWIENNHNTLKMLISNDRAVSEAEIIRDFIGYINMFKLKGESVYLWGNGILFDNKMIQNLCVKHGVNYPIFYRNDRDVRTFLETASFKSGLSEREVKDIITSQNENLVAHDALDDCKYQAKLVSFCYNTIMRSE